MIGLTIALCALGALLLLVLVTAWICFVRVFYAPKRKVLGADEYDIPPGEIYESYRDEMIAWTKEARTLPHEEMTITTSDGLTLRGSYYECKVGAPIEILFHGYQGNAERDLAGGIGRCFALGRNALLVNQRASGSSDGHVITFGIKECKDCLVWVDHVLARFGEDTKIILTGMSMGAATVMMAAGETLPDNVVCVLADCGYTSARDIIRKIIREMHLPDGILYPFVKLGARLFGRFSLDSNSPLAAMKRCRLPIIFIHGEADDFVPCEMSRTLYEACRAPKKLVTVPHAGHGLAFPVDKEGYLAALRDFQNECGFLDT